MKTMLSIGLDAKYEYGAFGEPLRVGGTAIAADNPFRFSTKYTDVDGARERVDGDAEGVARRAEEAGAPWALMRQTGLVYYGFRYYSPSLGRFLNRDPIGEMGGTNLYAFVENDPVNGWDYLGLEEACDPADSAAGLCDETPRRRGFFKRLGKGIGNAIGGIGRAVVGFAGGVGRAVENIGGMVVGAVGDIGTQIAGTVRNVASGIFGSGGDESIYKEHDGKGIKELPEEGFRYDRPTELEEKKRRQKSQSKKQEPFIRIEGNGDENDFIIIGDPDSTHVVMKLGPVGEVKVMGINNVETEILKEKVKVNIEVKRLELAGSLRFGVQRRDKNSSRRC